MQEVHMHPELKPSCAWPRELGCHQQISWYQGVYFYFNPYAAIGGPDWFERERESGSETHLVERVPLDVICTIEPQAVPKWTSADLKHKGL